MSETEHIARTSIGTDGHVDHKLDNLTRCDHLLPRASDTDGGHSIVSVHNDMNGQVEANDNP